MTPKQYEQIRELFLTARDLPAADREAYLESACADDAIIRQEVDALLANDVASEAFLSRAALGSGFELAGHLPAQVAETQATGRTQPQPGADQMPEHIGRYRLIEQLGAGGMGVVYRAEQDNPRREVALKLMRPGVTSQAAMRRFEHESYLLGRLQHPGIAQVFEAGSAVVGGITQPFFAMEYVDGEPMRAHLAKGSLNIRKRLDLLIQIADALQHAHQKGVIHRDLKPENILVDRHGRTKVLDFGVARATDADVQLTTIHSNVQQLIGTLAYMSPEQVSGDPAALDTRSDVYALAVVGYEMLTGRLPYDLNQQPLHSALRIVAEQASQPLSQSNPMLRGDLDTIWAKALSKEREQRYQTASEFAGDIRRYLHNEPISARPPSAIYQLRKFARRNRALCAAMVGLFITLIGGVAGMGVFLSRAIDAEALAKRRLDESETARATAQSETLKAQATATLLQDMLFAASPDAGPNRDVTVREILDAAEDKLNHLEHVEVEAAIRFTIGQTYLSLGDADRAERDLRQSISLFEQFGQGDSQECHNARTSLASSLRKQGRYDEAERIAAISLEGLQRVAGEHDIDTMAAQSIIGALQSDRGQIAAAQATFEALLALQLETLGPDHKETLTTQHNIISMLAKQRKSKAAEPLARELLAARRRVLGPKEASTLRSESMLGGILLQLGDWKGAEQVLADSMTRHLEVFGPDHRDTHYCKNNLAMCLVNQSRFAEAAEMLREILGENTQSLGTQDPATLAAMNNLARCLDELDEKDEAGRLYREILEIRQEKYGPRHVATLRSANNLASFLVGVGDFKQAEPLQRDCLAGMIETQGKGHIAALVARVNLAKSMFSLGRSEEAVALYHETYEIAKEHLAEGDWYVAYFEGRYGNCLLQLERYDDAETHLFAGLEGLRRTVGLQHKLTLEASENLAELYERTDRPEMSAQLRDAADQVLASP